MRKGPVERGADLAARLAAGVAAAVAVALLCFIGTQVFQDADFAIYGAERVGGGRCCGAPPITWAEVLGAVAVATCGVPAVAALAYLAMILVRVAAGGAPAAPPRPRRTFIAVAVVGVWAVVFAAFGWRP